MADETPPEQKDNESPEQAATADKEEKPDTTAFNNRHCLYAIVVIALVFGIITLCTRLLGTDDEESSPQSLVAATVAPSSSDDLYFNRISSFPVCLQMDPNCNVDNETVSEIIYASEDGNTLVYTDAARGVLGFIDITDPADPQPAGVVDVGGEPTSTVVVGPYVIVCVNTSPNFTDPSGVFHVIDIASQEVLRTGDLGGQPDATAVSPDKTFVAIAIENERDEDLNDGLLPQFPAGFLVIMDVSSENVADWTLSTLELTGLDGVLYPEDPEPEYVDINEDNICKLLLFGVFCFSFRRRERRMVSSNKPCCASSDFCCCCFLRCRYSPRK